MNLAQLVVVFCHKICQNVLELLKRLRMKIKFSEINQINVLSMLCQQYGEGELKLGKGKLRFCDKISDQGGILSNIYLETIFYTKDLGFLNKYKTGTKWREF